MFGEPILVDIAERDWIGGQRRGTPCGPGPRRLPRSVGDQNGLGTKQSQPQGGRPLRIRDRHAEIILPPPQQRADFQAGLSLPSFRIERARDLPSIQANRACPKSTDAEMRLSGDSLEQKGTPKNRIQRHNKVGSETKWPGIGDPACRRVVPKEGDLIAAKARMVDEPRGDHQQHCQCELVPPLSQDRPNHVASDHTTCKRLWARQILPDISHLIPARTRSR